MSLGYKTRTYGHGLLVGFANLCLLAQEGRSDDKLLEAIALAKDCTIPTSLAAIAPTLTSEEQAAILNAAVTAPDMGNMPNVVTRETLREAIHRVERWLSAPVNRRYKVWPGIKNSIS